MQPLPGSFARRHQLKTHNPDGDPVMVLEASTEEVEAMNLVYEIKDLVDLGMYVLAFRDPDNIQLEMTAPH